MKCQVCGAESGKYPLCRACNQKKEAGEVIKCALCGKWHYKDAPCSAKEAADPNAYLYEAKKSLLTRCETEFFTALRSAAPQGYHVFPQINLATFIDRTDNPRYRNELFRNVDFLITDAEYAPKLVIEINDQSHLTHDRQARDAKVEKICEEAGIPIIKLWTSYGVKPDYIQKRVEEGLASLPAKRVHHFDTNGASASKQSTSQSSNAGDGCYIATAVYGSYDCPEVWTLRRFRDTCLRHTAPGRLFVRAYYAISPTVVRLFGRQAWFNHLWRRVLDRFVGKLRGCGISDDPYSEGN